MTDADMTTTGDSRTRKVPWAARVFTLMLLPLAVACPQMIWVGVEDGSSIEALDLLVSDRPYGSVSVRPMLIIVGTCETYEASEMIGPDVEWRIDMMENGERFQRLRYGVTPEGYQERVAPKPLRPNGCYFLYGGESVTFFEVEADGLVTTISNPYRSRMAPESARRRRRTRRPRANRITGAR